MVTSECPRQVTGPSSSLSIRPSVYLSLGPPPSYHTGQGPVVWQSNIYLVLINFSQMKGETFQVN